MSTLRSVNRQCWSTMSLYFDVPAVVCLSCTGKLEFPTMHSPLVSEEKNI